ncbi:MAG: tetratricopeptide repeat protein [Sphingomonadaceae bacterium]|nr:tetratricopeptide repeat protein [Sphingomonadaceae bacterium]
MRKIAITAAAATALLGAGAASAAVTVIGGSAARSCYESAERENASDSALRTCNTALEPGVSLGHERVASFVNRGILYFYRGQYDRAIEDFDTAIALDPQEPEAFLNKGVALMRRDNSGQQALPLFSMAIEMGTEEEALAYYARGVANELNGDLTAAYYDIQRASQIAPEWDVPSRDLARFIVRPAN